MQSVNIESLKRDDDYCVDLGNGLWLMDNHKWALYVWERFRVASGVDRFTLVHADYHWDGGYDVFEPQQVLRLLNADPEELKTIIEREDGVQYDSFIAPAVARKMFDAVHFLCVQDDGSDVGIDESVRGPAGTQQVIHKTAASLAAEQFACPLIFDLCLDLFNKSDMFQEGDLWSDDDVLAFLVTVRPLIETAVLVTVSLSFDCSGTEDDTRHLASLVLPQIQAWRGP